MVPSFDTAVGILNPLNHKSPRNTFINWTQYQLLVSYILIAYVSPRDCVNKSIRRQVFLSGTQNVYKNVTRQRANYMQVIYLFVTVN